MILVSYDGSADAKAAIDRVAHLMPGAEATVLTVWEPFFDMLLRSGSASVGMGFGGGYPDDPGADERSRHHALEIAEAGAALARTAGLNAEARVAGRHGSIGQAILAAADDMDADAIVLGTRGRGGVTSFLLGSVSHEVVQHADRSVVVVPSVALAERRRGVPHFVAAPEPVA